MMNRRLATSLTCLVLLLGALGSAACHHKSPAVAPTPPPPPPAVTPVPTPPPPPPPSAPPAQRPLTEDEIFARESLDALNMAKPLDDAFFDFDSVVIRSDAQSALDKDARWLLRWTTTKVTVSGRCDERGTSEYNMALGERRAAAVRAYLVSLGIAADRIATVSYGEDRPFCTEHGESCWSQNRRGHFVITAK